MSQYYSIQACVHCGKVQEHILCQSCRDGAAEEDRANLRRAKADVDRQVLLLAARKVVGFFLANASRVGDLDCVRELADAVEKVEEP